MIRFVFLLSVCALAVACGDKKDGGGGSDCPAGEATLDGEPIQLVKGLGYSAGGSYVLQRFNHEDIECEAITSKKGRPVKDGEIEVRVGDGMGGAIGLGANTKAGPGVEVEITSKPSKAGDPMAMCVKTPTEYELQVGDHKGKTLVMKGQFEGTYCGEFGE